MMDSTNAPTDVYIAVDCDECEYTVDGISKDLFEIGRNGYLHFTMTGPDDAYAIAIVGQVDGEIGTQRENGSRCNDSAIAFAAGAPAKLKVRGSKSTYEFPITLLCMARDEHGYYRPSCPPETKTMMMTTGGPKMKVGD